MISSVFSVFKKFFCWSIVIMFDRFSDVNVWLQGCAPFCEIISKLLCFFNTPPPSNFLKVINLLNYFVFSYLIPVIIKRKAAFSHAFSKFNTIKQGPTRFKYVCWTMSSRLGLLLTLDVWVITCLDWTFGVYFFLYTFSKQQWNLSYPKNICGILLMQKQLCNYS